MQRLKSTPELRREVRCDGYFEPAHFTRDAVAVVFLESGERKMFCSCCAIDFIADPRTCASDRFCATASQAAAAPFQLRIAARRAPQKYA